MNTWFAVYCHAQSEAQAAYNLKHQNFEIYLPRYLRKCRHARRVDWVPAPLFPRYLFIGMDTEKKGWGSVRSTVGVSHLVSFGGRPTPVPIEILDALKALEDLEGYVNFRAGAKFSKGDLIEILGGAFSEHIGLIQELDDKGRVTLLLDLMGRQTKVKTTLENIAAAA